MAGEVNTINTTLKFGEDKLTLTKLCAIKDYPDLGGEPEMIEITDLDDDTQRFILGVQSIGALAFTANYTKETFEAVNAKERKAGFYELEFGTAGVDGIFEWEGQHVVFPVGGGVNSPREMRIVIAASSKIKPKTA